MWLTHTRHITHHSHDYFFMNPMRLGPAVDLRFSPGLPPAIDRIVAFSCSVQSINEQKIFSISAAPGPVSPFVIFSKTWINIIFKCSFSCCVRSCPNLLWVAASSFFNNCIYRRVISFVLDQRKIVPARWVGFHRFLCLWPRQQAQRFEAWVFHSFSKAQRYLSSVFLP